MMQNSSREIDPKTNQTSLGELKIRDIQSPDGFIQCTIISKDTIYFVSDDSSKKKLYKQNLETKETAEFDFQDFEECTSIKYNKSINRVFVTVEELGVYWFEPGQENQITRMQCFPAELSWFYKMGMVFNGVQGILKDDFKQVYYCPNLLEDQTSIQLDIESSNISEVVFLSNKHVAVLYHNNRKLVVVDLEENKKISELKIHSEGFATSMSIDEDKQIILVGVRDGKAQDDFSSWGYLYQFKVEHRRGAAPTVEQLGEPLSLGESNCGVYDLKIARMAKFGSQLVVLASIFCLQSGKKQIRFFYIDEIFKRITEVYDIPDVPYVSNRREMYNIEQFEDSFIFGGEGGNRVALVTFE